MPVLGLLFDGCPSGRIWVFLTQPLLAWLLLGASLIYAGGCFLNDACDHKFDQKNRPERPIPSGSLTLAQAWALGFYKC